jgi:pectin-derived oligosaccharide transport system permease protein
MIGIIPSGTKKSLLRTRALRGGSRHLVLLLGAALMVYPLAWMLGSSLKHPDSIFSSPSPLPASLDVTGYTQGWFALGPPFSLFFLNSLIICAGAVIGNVLSCSLAAFAFARLQFRFKRVLFAVMLGTLMLPLHVLVVPQYILFKQLGWINTFLPLVVPKFFAVDAFFIFLLVQFMRAIPLELEEAAALDGCSAFGFYRKIVMPLSVPALATTAIFTFFFTYNDFLSQLLYLSDVQKFTVSMALRSFVDTTSLSSYNGLFAMSTLALLPILGFFVAFQRLIVDGINTTGFK